MAGFYPDVPAPRMPYDRDGTQVFKVDTANSISQLSAANVTALNDEGNSLWSGGSGKWLGFIFPELRDITAMFIANYNGWGDPNVGQVAWSTDTTNILDGTWTQAYASFTALSSTALIPDYRTNIQPVTGLSGIKAIRFYWTQGGASTNVNWRAVHFYGNITAGENPDRLALWHPTLDQELPGAWFDFGDKARTMTDTRTFRVKNLSPSLTAQTVSVDREALTDTTPTVVSMHTLSSDGVTFVTSLSLGNLAPGAISPVLTVKEIIASNAVLGPWAVRIYADAASWA